VPEVANHHPAQRVLAALRRGRDATRRRNVGRTRTARLGTALVCLVAALLIAVSAVNARGSDLRPARTTDLVSLVQDQSRRNAQLTGQLTGLRAQGATAAQAASGLLVLCLAMALGMVVLIGIVMAFYAWVQRRTQRWLS